MVGLLALIGCGGGPSVAPADVVTAEPPDRSGLVWIRDPGGTEHTYWVSESGEALASQPIEGPLWALDHTLWQWVVEPVEVPVYESEPGGDEPDSGGDPANGPTPSGSETMSRVVLRELVEDVRVEVVPAPTPGHVRMAGHSVALHGSAGPYVFITQALYVDAFGAHGSSESSALVWDLRTAGPADVLTDRERAHVERVEAATALEALTHPPDSEMGVDEDATASLVALSPRWEPTLVLELQFTAPACYACGDGEWSDYTRSARLPMASPPERLAPYAQPPSWAQAVLDAVPGARLLGYSAVTEREPARVLDSLRR